MDFIAPSLFALRAGRSRYGLHLARGFAASQTWARYLITWPLDWDAVLGAGRAVLTGHTSDSQRHSAPKTSEPTDQAIEQRALTCHLRNR